MYYKPQVTKTQRLQGYGIFGRVILPWDSLEAGAVSTAFSLPSPSPSRSSPLLCPESLGFLPEGYLQSILSQAACQMEGLKEAE